MKMTETKVFLMELVAVAIAVEIAVLLIIIGFPGVLTLPICAIVSWYFMGFFWAKYGEREKKDYGE
jgi:uncharacterized RDD family membrane protein YckC